MPTASGPSRAFAVLLGASLIALVGCNATSDTTAPTANLASESGTGLAATGSGSSKVGVCHRTNGANPFILITIAEPAVPAHRAHGDAAIGEPVPVDPSKIFDDSCTPVQPPPVATCSNSNSSR